MPDTLPFDPTRKPELTKPGKRKPLNRVQIITLCARQKLLCGCGCGDPLDPVCIDEHIVPRETLPADRCDDLENRALFNVACAKSKTVADQGVIGHWRRVRGDSGQRARRAKNGPQLVSRNTFDQPPLPNIKDRISKSPGSITSAGFKRKIPSRPFEKRVKT